jgi:hypothetical protein
MVRLLLFLTALLFATPSLAQEAAQQKCVTLNQPPDTLTEQAETRSLMTDVAVIAAVIAASRAAYLAMGKPCACPDNVDLAGRSCGRRSAHSRPGGFKPLCITSDVTAAMIATWRATGAIPTL